MLIKALCDYYDLKTQQSVSALPDGYSMQPVHYLVELRESGEIAAINDYREKRDIPQKNGKAKEKLVPREVALPERSQKPAIFSALIEHRPKYLFGLNYADGQLTPDDDKNNAAKSHEAFVQRNSEFFAELNSPICTAFRNFVEKWTPSEQTENEHLKKLGKDYSGAYFTFALYDDITKTPQGDPQFVEKYQSAAAAEQSAAENAYTAVCPVMGECLPTARIHDKIKFPGGNTTGCVLVGMKESAYESYGKTQSYNSNISEAAMKKYTAAFNDLLSDSSHRIFINSMVIVFFALKKDDSAEAGLFSALFGVSEKGDANAAFSDAMKRLKRGEKVDYSELDIDENVDFYVAGFTPNSSRICQKFIVHNSFGKLMENAARHQRDMALSGNDRQVYFGNIAHELISPKSTKDEIPPPLMTGIIRAAIEGSAYPEALLQTAVMRVKTDHDEEKNHFIKFNYTRVGMIKACLNRKNRKSNKEEEITMALNKENTDPAYLCGRLFAVLEKLQQDAAGGSLNTTIVDSYFSSACSKPSTVFPKLVELSFHHIKKLERDSSKVFYKNLIGSIVDPLNDEIPTTLDLDGQGRFIVGYFQQNQDFYTKKEKEN